MSQICVMCPSRDRPERIPRLYRSMLETSEDAELIVYVDKDQGDRYVAELAGLNPTIYDLVNGNLMRRGHVTGQRLTLVLGPRHGPVHSDNTIAHLFRDPFWIYGAVPDDAEFKILGWDRYLIDRFREIPGQIGIVSAAHNCGACVNFAWVSRAWIEAVGWYFYPHNFHHCCDTVLEILGECSNAITWAPAEKFLMQHDSGGTQNNEAFAADSLNFLMWCVNERRNLVHRIREAVVGLPA